MRIPITENFTHGQVEEALEMANSGLVTRLGEFSDDNGSVWTTWKVKDYITSLYGDEPKLARVGECSCEATVRCKHMAAAMVASILDK